MYSICMATWKAMTNSRPRGVLLMLGVSQALKYA